jgi:hypothetical protein
VPEPIWDLNLKGWHSGKNYFNSQKMRANEELHPGFLELGSFGLLMSNLIFGWIFALKKG